MSIASYSELKQAAANWLNRGDLTSYIPDFVTLFENAANRRLRVRQMQLNTPLTPSSGSAVLPTDYLDWIRVTWTGSPRRELLYVHPSYLQQQYPDVPSDTPSVFTIEGSGSGAGIVKIMPTDPTALDFNYYQKISLL